MPASVPYSSVYNVIRGNRGCYPKVAVREGGLEPAKDYGGGRMRSQSPTDVQARSGGSRVHELRSSDPLEVFHHRL